MLLINKIINGFDCITSRETVEYKFFFSFLSIPTAAQNAAVISLGEIARCGL